MYSLKKKNVSLLSSFICIVSQITDVLWAIISLSHGDGSSFERSFLHDIDAGTFLSERPRYEYYIKTYCYLTCALAAKLDRDRCCSMIKGKIFECTREWEDKALFYMCPSWASLLHSPRGLLTSQNCDPN